MHTPFIALHNIHLPDTIIFKFQRPVFWYFTSLDGTILRHSEEKLTAECIFASLSNNHSSDCDIIAMYLYTKGKCMETYKTLVGFDHAGDKSMPEALRNVKYKDKKDVVVEFLDVAALSMRNV